ncbi:hypothetical protein IWW57_002279 [Coemansia sp. S610]|uniref:Uncharacterized protein n=1 Tax=Coemansia linderi TaxID=2663919 RepID=A0ACC1KNY1_9FUNG|nr:hypothetical protein IWW57_002279 [Coemansia sp. S610]KAJ2792559.1 hypothetical protein GGI18_000295 [Coemansia linderi]
MHLPLIIAWICLIAAVSSASSRPSSTANPLAQWIGDMYNGLNEMRVTAVTSAPLRLRSALNALAQSQAIAMCNTNSAALSDSQLVASLASSAGIRTDNAHMLAARGQASVGAVIASWAGASPGKTSPLSAIIYPTYVYVGMGVCGDDWVVILTSEFV